MIRLIYASSATREMSADDLLFLLEQSRRRNERQNVTGMLLFVGESFIQVPEGAEKDVEEIYEDVLDDDRNTANTVMLKDEITERAFPDWSMGFKHISEKNRGELEGYTEFLDKKFTPEEIAGLSKKAIRLLYFFKEIYVTRDGNTA